jgi:hypothetical protein
MNKVLGWFKKIINSVLGRRDQIERVFDLVLDALPVAYDIVAVVAAITPSQLDDVTLAAMRNSFPKLFDGSLTTDERKLYLLATAAELLKRRYPEASTSVARLAVQLAYVLWKNGVKLQGDK